MTTTYYVPMETSGLPTKAQRGKLGTSAYGFRTIARALAYTPAGGYVEERHCERGQDWGGRIVANKPAPAGHNM